METTPTTTPTPTTAKPPKTKKPATAKRVKQSAGVLPVYNGQLVFITKRKSAERKWIFPKGKIEIGEESFEAAQREAFEEGGLVGRADPVPFARVKQINYHVMHVDDLKDEYLEAHKRFRVLMSPQDALNDVNVRDYVKNVIREAQINKIV